MNLTPMIDEPMEKDIAEQLNPINLAFIGDCVQTLYLRTKLVSSSDFKTGHLHKLVAQEINATNQSRVAEQLLEIFTEAEMTIYKRARNSKFNTSAKNANVIDYKKASGLEAVIGYLYLTGQNDRLEYILEQGGNL